MLTPDHAFQPDGDPFAAEQRAVNAELAALRAQVEQLTTERNNARTNTRMWRRRVTEAANVVECLEGRLEAMQDGSNAHAANLTRMARENVELHTTNARYKAALEQYAADENWQYFVSNDSFAWARDEHPATIAAKSLHEEE